MCKVIISIVLTTFVYSGIAGSETPKKPLDSGPTGRFYSDELLQMAKVEILIMKLRQLRLYADYLAECVNMARSDINKNQCDVALERYELEYKRNGDLDSLNVEFRVAAMKISADNIAGEEDNMKLMMRYIDVRETLASAVNDRFQMIHSMNPEKY